MRTVYKLKDYLPDVDIRIVHSNMSSKHLHSVHCSKVHYLTVQNNNSVVRVSVVMAKSPWRSVLCVSVAMAKCVVFSVAMAKCVACFSGDGEVCR